MAGRVGLADTVHVADQSIIMSIMSVSLDACIGRDVTVYPDADCRLWVWVAGLTVTDGPSRGGARHAVAIEMRRIIVLRIGWESIRLRMRHLCI